MTTRTRTHVPHYNLLTAAGRIAGLQKRHGDDAADLVPSLARRILGWCAGERIIGRTRGAGSIARQLRYAGVEISEHSLNVELERLVIRGTVRVSGAGMGDFALDHARHTEARACIQAVYDWSDTLFGNKRHETVESDGCRTDVRAWNVCIGHLRKRWANGNFKAPRIATMKRWAQPHCQHTLVATPPKSAPQQSRLFTSVA